jgi:ubiquinone/menaquinone biosynthesis C-methylase UbiE
MKEKISDRQFKIMHFVMRCFDGVSARVKNRAINFGIKEGETIVDYACGPGRYTVEFSKLVGKNGKVIAIDHVEMALDIIKNKAKKFELKNIETILPKGYNSTLPSAIADKVFAIDVIHMIENPFQFLKELNRICKDDGIMIIDKGHQSEKKLKQTVESSVAWKIIEENKDHLKCIKY